MVSRQAGLQLEGAEVFPSLDAAIVRADAWAREQGVDELMLIGGAQLYEQGLALAERLYLTRVALQPEGDAWFPVFAEEAWRCCECEEHEAGESTPAHRFETWQRR